MSFKPAADTTANAIPANKKATAYLNFYLPNKDGSKRKINTGLVLRAANEQETKLAEYLLNDPDGTRLAHFKDQLIIECNSAEASEGSAFDLPGM